MRGSPEALARAFTGWHYKNPGDANEAQRFVDLEWAEEKVDTRYAWLFRYDVTSAPV
jgi:hypothetical protein